MQQPGNGVPAPCSRRSPPVQNKPRPRPHPPQQITLPSRLPAQPARQAAMPPGKTRQKKEKGVTTTAVTTIKRCLYGTVLQHSINGSQLSSQMRLHSPCKRVE